YTPPLGSTSAPTVAPIRAQLRIPRVPYRFIGSFFLPSARFSRGALVALGGESPPRIWETGGKRTHESVEGHGDSTGARPRGTLAVLWRQQALQAVHLAAAGDREVADRVLQPPRECQARRVGL